MTNAWITTNPHPCERVKAGYYMCAECAEGTPETMIWGARATAARIQLETALRAARSSARDGWGDS